jgi:hypothetical protein
MKNLFTLAAICLFTLVAAAQKITTANLSGTWKMQGLEMQGNKVDLVAQTVTFSEEWKKLNPDVDPAAAELAMMEQMSSFGDMEFSFNDTTMGIGMDGTVMEEMPYKIIDRDGKQYIESPDDPTDTPEVSMKDGLLSMYVDTDDGKITMIFKKA